LRLSTGGVQLCAPPHESWPGLLARLARLPLLLLALAPPPPLLPPKVPAALGPPPFGALLAAAAALAAAESGAKACRKPACVSTRWQRCQRLTLLSQRSMAPCLPAADEVMLLISDQQA
jgi:hypothetical protein